jgi:hypothetical protein
VDGRDKPGHDGRDKENAIGHLIATSSGITDIRIMAGNKKILPGLGIARNTECGVPRKRPAACG